jgi:hypothetical protein
MHPRAQDLPALSRPPIDDPYAGRTNEELLNEFTGCVVAAARAGLRLELSDPTEPALLDERRRGLLAPVRASGRAQQAIHDARAMELRAEIIARMSG